MSPAGTNNSKQVHILEKFMAHSNAGEIFLCRKGHIVEEYKNVLCFQSCKRKVMNAFCCTHLLFIQTV